MRDHATARHPGVSFQGVNHGALWFATMLSMFTFTAYGCRPESTTSALPQYHGKTRAEIIMELGEPDRIEEFAMEDVTDEFRIGLQNTYPLSDAANANVQIQELWWDNGSRWITLWFHELDGQWTAFDSIRWDKDIRF